MVEKNHSEMSLIPYVSMLIFLREVFWDCLLFKYSLQVISEFMLYIGMTFENFIIGSFKIMPHRQRSFDM